MKRIVFSLAWVVFLSIVVPSAFAQVQPAPASPGKTASAASQTANAPAAHLDTPKPQLGSKELPLVVRTLEEPDATAERSAAKQHRAFEQANGRTTLSIAFFMAAVALAQLFLFVWQLSLMRKSVEDAGAAAVAAASAARSADLNARAAIGIELPVIRAIPPDELLSTNRLIDNGPYAGVVNDGPPTKYSAIGNLELRNDGRTPAFLSQISVGWTVVDVLPEKPTYHRTDRFGHASIVKPGKTFHTDLHYGIELSDDQRELVRAETAWLWFYGMIEYRDFLDERRLARFCWRFANRNVGTVFFSFDSDGNPPERYTGTGRVIVAGVVTT